LPQLTHAESTHSEQIENASFARKQVATR
jgi:hypothetical protein